ncbi:hypothetical protein Dsin_001671 [Dipteronia sinensis]|uniref:HAT C-terminal dimerisation domain-containing protein n=1 Tax=Dipteronia sinensis TaxID=43782 RepID=A0AAE0B5R8_9ROSI|nr:hypothetical protein Dsin_001671 [Dipteronia sinensis]
MASGGDDSSLRNLDRGKGQLQDLLEHKGDDVNYNDRIYHEFLQREFGSDLSPNSNPPLIISEPNLNTPTSNENISTPSTMLPSSDDFYSGEEEKPLKSDLFKTHMKKTELDDGTIKIKCNYCPKTYKTSKNFGHGTYWAYIRKNYQSEMVKASNQAQISRPIRDSINYIWKHNKIHKQWLRFCSQNSRRPINFSRDISTCWNSTYKLLSESVEYNELLVSFITYNVPSISLQLKHWDVCIKILELLRVFNDATNALSGVYYPTTHLFLIQSVNIAGAISECELDIQLSQCVATMKTKWLNYYEEIPIIYLLASCFDPRFKLECLQDYLTHYYNSLGKEVDTLNYCNSVKTLLYELYDEYLKIYGPSLNISVSQPQPTSDGTTSSLRFKLKGLGERLFSDRAKKLPTSYSFSSSSISELDRYLQTNHEFLEDSEFSIQVWWKNHEKVFPILAIIAKQILGTPVSTVAVEQEFSAGGNILEPRRSVLCPQSLEAQACVDDWTKAKFRQQELEPEIVNDFFEDDQTKGTEGSE